MGKFGLSNPTVDFVIEVLKTLNREELEQIGRAVMDQLSKRQVININRGTAVPDEEVNSEDLFTNSNSDNSLALMLQGLLGKGGIQNLLGNEKNLAKLLSLLKGSNLAVDAEPAINIPNLSSGGFSLPNIMQMASQLFNTGSGDGTPSREEALFDAMLSFISPGRRNQMQSLSPLIKMFSTLQSMTGKKFSLSKIATIFRPH